MGHAVRGPWRRSHECRRWVGSGSLIEIVGGIALFALVLPGLGVFVPLWFPTGRALTPRWRWVSAVATVGVIGLIGGWALLALEGAGSADVDSCVSVATCANIIGLFLILVAIVAAIVSLVVRWFRSRGVERLQMKWLVLAFIVFLIGVLAEFGGFQYSIVANVFLPAGFVLVPVSIGIAVTRYRLYEVDRILSRTVSYVIVVGLLAAVFFGVVTATSTLLDTSSDSSSLLRHWRWLRCSTLSVSVFNGGGPPVQPIPV